MKETDFEFKSVEPGTWKPENEGDSIFGVFINEEPRDEEKDIGARYYLENGDGITMIWGSAVLDERMKLIKNGTPVKITFKGQKKSQKGRDMNVFEVEVGKPKTTTTETKTETPAESTPPEEKAE